MAKEKFERKKPHVNVGTIGHVDHGKTTLTAAITTVLSRKFGGEAKAYDQIDAAPEEKARGITLDLGYAYRRLADPGGADPVLGFIDVPGHEKLIHNMLAGATGIDFALLVVAVPAAQERQPQGGHEFGELNAAQPDGQPDAGTEQQRDEDERPPNDAIDLVEDFEHARLLRFLWGECAHW